VFLGGGNGIEWKGMKRIIFEYSSLSLFGSFNGGNGIKFNDFFTKTPKIPLYIQFFILK